MVKPKLIQVSPERMALIILNNIIQNSFDLLMCNEYVIKKDGEAMIWQIITTKKKITIVIRKGEPLEDCLVSIDSGLNIELTTLEHIFKNYL
jgi:hypothetical protein